MDSKSGVTLSHIVTDSLLSTVRFDNLDENWVISETSSEHLKEKTHFSMLTISSYEFKAISLLHFTHDDGLQSYIKRCLKIQNDDLPETRFYDYINEVANNFSGLLKRVLHELDSSLGMSTPNILSGCCSDFLDSNREVGQAHAKAELGDVAVFYGSFYLFASDNVDLHKIESWRPEEDDTVSGELEFF